MSRRDTSFRHVRNVAEVEKMLNTFGFRSYELSPLSLREKVALLAGAYRPRPWWGR
ncbi:glycosyltransferase 61 family protein [Hymenobacter cellulosivorans]|uniref:Glycosyltransferase family 61 protein n=1 Tax=Hymenobacter cellulosivorans TaxID=2932249 RepID=A0ABY4F298_9BACT|nr:glycosyltransferase 61 family protein [Hymenobacter cellulosivorans]UOQ50798.1 glycosyltransferase family 61 protein [Hymenobacter cellulosivorans]